MTSQAGSPDCDNNLESLCSHQSSGSRGEWRDLRQPGSLPDRLGTHSRKGWAGSVLKSHGTSFCMLSPMALELAGMLSDPAAPRPASLSSLRYPVGDVSLERSYCHLSCTPGPLGTSLSSSYLRCVYSTLRTGQSGGGKRRGGVKGKAAGPFLKIKALKWSSCQDGLISRC